MSNSCAACGAASLEPHLRVGQTLDQQGLIPTTDRYGSALSDIVRCRRCGHGQLERFPSPSFLEDGYADAASADYVAEEPGQRATGRAALRVIERHVGRGALLDVGCWLGFLLAEARDRGWRTVGIEPSRFAAEFARERLGLDVLTGDLSSAAELPARQFQAVVMGDLIEHLPDPGAALDRAAQLLAADGVLYMALPDAGSRLARALGARWWSVIPTHVQYFTRDSVAILLSRHGWSVRHVGTAPKVFTVRYYLDRLRGYSPALARMLIRCAQAVGLSERLWAPDFRDRMAVVAAPRRAPRPDAIGSP